MEKPRPAIVSVVGISNAGKTTLIEKLIPELNRRGYRVGTVKHAHHGFSMDKPGKDSFRHRAAGAATAIVTSPGQLAMVKDVDHIDPDDLMVYCRDLDLLITEGFKGNRHPKIEVFRPEQGERPFDPIENRIAFVSSADIDLGVPRFAPDDVIPLVDLIATRFLNQR